jgi:hypothetical protein
MTGRVAYGRPFIFFVSDIAGQRYVRRDMPYFIFEVAEGRVSAGGHALVE